MSFCKKEWLVPAVVYVVLNILPRYALAEWPIAKYSNGTVGIKGSEAHVKSDETRVTGNMIVEGNLFVNGREVSFPPPRCVAPGGEALHFDGTTYTCVCADG